MAFNRTGFITAMSNFFVRHKWPCFLFFLLLLFFTANCFAQTGNCNPSINITHLPHTLCINQTPTFTATAFNAGNNPIYRWKKNGIAVGTNSPNYSGPLTVNDDMVCELTTTSCSNNTTVVSNRFIFEPFNSAPPEVIAVASQQNICAGATVTFTATNKSGNTNPAYQWFVNGSPIAGTNSTVFSTNTLTDSSVVQCMMTVSTCLNGGGSTKDYSDPIVIRIQQPLNPGVSISTATPVACQGSVVSFTAVASQAGSNPVYEWKVNGTTVFTGLSFSTSVLADGDLVSCRLSVDPSSNCGVAASATSNTITMSVKDLLSPSINITASDIEICSGTPVIFTTNIADAGVNPAYQWQLNGVNTGTNSPNYSNSLLKDGDQINCVLTTSSGCNNAAVSSNAITMLVNKSPVISIAMDSLTIWAGEQVQLQASVSGDVASYVWSPAGKLNDAASLTPLTIPLLANTNFQLDAVSGKGCIASKTIQVKVLRKLSMPNSFTPNMDGNNDVFRIPPGVPIALKEFSIFDRWGNRVFSTTDVNLGWNGLLKGRAADTGVYVYIIKGRYENQEVVVKGHAVLIR